MKRNFRIVLVGVFLLSFESLSKVATIYMNDQKMEEVRVQIGKSTLLSFPSKPLKAVVGSPDSLDLEFTGNE